MVSQRRRPAAPPLQTILDAIGDTPVVRLQRVAPAGCAAIFAKLEAFNPGGSVKDRIAIAMIEAAEQDGRLLPHGAVVEPTSGNTGVGLALACAVKEYALTLVMPDSTALEHRQIFESYGAEIVLTPAEAGIPATVERARDIARTTGALLLDQFANPANPAAHRRHTGPELAAAFASIGACVDALVVGVGTGGTLAGIAPVVRRQWPGIRLVAVEPTSSAVLSGGPAGVTRIQGLGAGFIPPVLDPSSYDRVETVSDEDAWEMKLRLGREEGLLVGLSSGAAVVASVRIGRELGSGSTIATILPDTGERYFSVAEWFGCEGTR